MWPAAPMDAGRWHARGTPSTSASPTPPPSARARGPARTRAKPKARANSPEVPPRPSTAMAVRDEAELPLLERPSSCMGEAPARPPSMREARGVPRTARAERTQQGGSREAEVWPNDPALTMVAKKLTKALVLHYKRQPVKNGAVTWSRFFDECCAPQVPGLITFAEFDRAARAKLKACVTMYELRVFWRRLDADNSGHATVAEFTRAMYIIELSTWPDISQKEVDHVVHMLNAAADKWHHAGGNWFKVFSLVDYDGSGTLAYDELRQCIRSTPPGLRLRETDLPERCIQGFWKLLDSEADIEIPVYRFMAFMRKHAGHSVQRPDMHSMQEVEKARELPLDTPERSVEQLRVVMLDLEAAMQKYYASKGQHNHTVSDGMWHLFFKEADVEGTGRLTFKQWRDALLRKLKQWRFCTKEDDIVALWGLVDPRKTGEATWEDVSIAFYRLEVSLWPDEDDESIEGVVEELTVALKRRLLSGGNWYKAVLLVDRQGAGKIKFPAFREMVRDSQEGLALSPALISDKKLKAFWKRLDVGLNREVAISDFMVFMKRFGGRTRSICDEGQQHSCQHDLPGGWEDCVPQAVANAPTLSKDIVCALATRLSLAINAFLSSRGIRQPLGCPRHWGTLIECLGTQKHMRLRWSEFMVAVRKVLRLGADVASDGELRAFWKEVDPRNIGDASAADFDRAIYRIQIETWPVLTDTDVAKVLGLLNAAAEKWHRTGGNWYKIFTACDEDGSGSMGYQEFVKIVRRGYPGLSISASLVSDAELRGLWRALDREASGTVGAKEFMGFMRTHGKELSHRGARCASKCEAGEPVEEPPPRSKDELRDIIRRLNEALARYWKRRGVGKGATFRVSRMWSRFFAEAEASGRLSFARLERSLRRAFFGGRRFETSRGAPGPPEAVAEDCLSFVRIEAVAWSGVGDLDGEGRGSVDGQGQEIRQRGGYYLSHVHTGEPNLDGFIVTALELEVEGAGKGDSGVEVSLIRGASQAPLLLLPCEAREGRRSARIEGLSEDCAPKRGDKLRIDLRCSATEGSVVSVREVSVQLKAHAAERPPSLGASLTSEDLVARDVTRGDLLALWHAVVPGRSSEVPASGWYLPCYRLQLEAWPEADEAALVQVVDKMSEAADKWHRAGGNWYKVFNLCDTEGSGRMSFDEFLDIIRRPLPCLAIPPQRLSESELRGLWKAMDVDRSGDVNVSEFMVFMRRLEVKRGVSHTPTVAKGSVVHRAKQMIARQHSGRDALSAEKLCMLREALCSTTPQAIAEAHRSWGREPWEGAVSEWDFHGVVREVLGIDEGRLDDLAVYAAWCAFDVHGEGSVPVEALVGSQEGPEAALERLFDLPGDFAARYDEALRSRRISEGGPLHRAAGTNHAEEASLLIRGADIGEGNDDGETPLHHAVRMGCLDTAMLLLEHGADIDARSRQGNTVLQYACFLHPADQPCDEEQLQAAAWNCRAMLLLLILAGADAHATGDGGLTAADRLGHARPLELLLIRSVDRISRWLHDELEVKLPQSLSHLFRRHPDLEDVRVAFEILLRRRGNAGCEWATRVGATRGR